MEFDKNKIKTKIAISKIKEENDIVMENKTKNIFKMLTTALAGIVLTTGVVFAGTKVIESIWSTPTKVEFSEEITEDVQKENISIEEAQKKAIEVLSNIGFNTNIVKNNQYKDPTSNEITYRFYTEDEYQININGITGEFFDIWDESKRMQNNNILISEEEAIDRANYFYKLFGYEENEYEITNVYVNNKEGSGKGSGFNVLITYNKKYGEIINPYEYIEITIDAGTDRLGMFRVDNCDFDNNEILISKEDAIKIALKEDEKIESNTIESTDAKLMVVKMNADAYDRLKDKEKYYKSKQTVDYPNEERNYYNVEEKIRNAWVVVITYEDTYDGDIVRRYTEGQYSYFVDATSGEIIGGHVMDYTYSAK